MTDRETDAKVATMMGWEVKWHHRARAWLSREKGSTFTNLPSFTTDPAADYTVLQWAESQQCGPAHLYLRWRDRVRSQVGHPGDYETGDYSKAALAVWEE